MTGSADFRYPYTSKTGSIVMPEITQDNIEKLVTEMVDQMDIDTLMDIVYEDLFNFYHKQATQQEFDEEWDRVFPK